MEWTPLTIFIFLFSGTAGVLAYGLLKRPVWMWYLGWWMFYLFAIYFGDGFIAMFTHMRDTKDLAMSLLWLVGGFLIWIVGVRWWSKNRHQFGRSTDAQKGK
ncbi:hypothetical protein [Roseimicrobium sp. ORNL1]|uniref:hypothetical protein n=1 Tax=Roseimicrobium sp. ORNL1 TaxID=2711231 RepID=UPI0013E19C21|nr:hypothetical protein [Roseimicrobium sp. ORNL1]QIF04328.1 hypothetical protein G5S37_23320 [Roseimicrobium sp. ORNL1]